MHAYITKLAGHVDDLLRNSMAFLFAHLMFNLSLSLDVNGLFVLSGAHDLFYGAPHLCEGKRGSSFSRCT